MIEDSSGVVKPLVNAGKSLLDSPIDGRRGDRGIGVIGESAVANRLQMHQTMGVHHQLPVEHRPHVFDDSLQLN